MKTNIDETKKITESVEGFLSGDEGMLLYNLAKKCSGKGVIVEIGSWKGKSTIWLANGSKDGSKTKIYAVDPHIGDLETQKEGEAGTLGEFKNNIKMADAEDIVIPVVKTSEAAAKNFSEPIELLFIDGDHRYEFVKLDFELWFPKVIEGGIIAFHDTGWPGPKKLVKESVYRSEFFRNTRLVDSITVGEKVGQNSFRDRIKNKYILFLIDACDLARRVRLPKPIKTFGKIIYNKMHR